jgi:hypothetical protein
MTKERLEVMDSNAPIFLLCQRSRAEQFRPGFDDHDVSEDLQFSNARLTGTDRWSGAKGANVSAEQ